jgi:hypothetical protein
MARATTRRRGSSRSERILHEPATKLVVKKSHHNEKAGAMSRPQFEVYLLRNTTAENGYLCRLIRE